MESAIKVMIYDPVAGCRREAFSTRDQEEFTRTDDCVCRRLVEIFSVGRELLNRLVEFISDCIALSITGLSCDDSLHSAKDSSAGSVVRGVENGTFINQSLKGNRHILMLSD